MTMTFQASCAHDRGARPGERIRATVDLTTEPWTIVGPSVAPRRRQAAGGRRPLGTAGSCGRSLIPMRASSIKTGGSSRARLARPAARAGLHLYALPRPADVPADLGEVPGSATALGGLASAPARGHARPGIRPRRRPPPVRATFGADAARWTLATGDPIEILTFAKRFGIETERAQGDVILHSERTAIVGSDGRIGLLLDGNRWAPDDIVTELAALERGANPPLGAQVGSGSRKPTRRSAGRAASGRSPPSSRSQRSWS